MANVEQFQNEAPLVTQRTGILATSSNALARIREVIDQPGFRRAFPTLLATLTAVAAIVLYLGMQKPEMTTLYSSLSENEKSRVLNALKNMGIEVQLDPATGEILVPADEYHQSRISLAAQGLPEFAGNEANNLENLPLGISRSVEGVRLRQVQEAELAKSITEISSVKSARVHLALPEKSVFVRDQTPPTASVFVSLKNGRKLEKTQVLAITNLVSASVPAMSPNNVSIIDQFEKVTDKDAALYTRKLAKLEGIFAGNSCGAAIKGLLQLKENFKKNNIVVVLLHDSGSRYIGKIYNDDWMKKMKFL